MQHPFSLAGETALITGGGSGIGLGIATCFVQAGARVVLVGRRRDVLEQAVAGLGQAASFEPHDVNQLEQAEALIERVAQRVGQISILVNNAGFHIKKPAVQTTVEDLQAILQTHVLGAFGLTHAVLPAMIERRHGSILFTASMASLFGLPNAIAYAAAKSAYLGIVRTLATEISGQGVRVNAIAPGWIETDMVRQALAGDPERERRIMDRTPMKRLGEPQDIGWAATYLCSEEAKFVTGVVLPVDGGASIGF
jgi:NAD(P)-dependent dehydrogenase (short-subunit alcohol dehydrogenase family)